MLSRSVQRPLFYGYCITITSCLLPGYRIVTAGNAGELITEPAPSLLVVYLIPYMLKGWAGSSPQLNLNARDQEYLS